MNSSPDGNRVADLGARAFSAGPSSMIADARSADVMIDFDSDSPILVVAFGGLLGHLGGLPSFEFMQTLSRFQVKRVFVRDPQALWYHGGVGGLGSTVEELAHELGVLVREANAQRVVFLGASSGGYAAILLAGLIPVHRVLAFVPQTLVDPAGRAAIGDERWPAVTRRAAQRLDRRYVDLAPLLEAAAVSCPIEVHYALGETLDAMHAERLAGLPCVQLVPHDFGVGGHGLPLILKQQGHLGGVVSTAIFD